MAGIDPPASFGRRTADGDGYGYEIDGLRPNRRKVRADPSDDRSASAYERRGTTLTFWRSEADGPLEQIGSADFDPGPISEVAFLADALNSGDGFDVRFDRIEILADRIERP